MLRVIFGALMGALRFIWGVVTLPLRLFAPGPGRSAMRPPPDVAGQIREAIAEADKLEAVRPAPSGPPAADRYAVRVMRWASATVSGRYEQAERISGALPAALRTWTLSLTTDQARALLKARLSGISAHLDGSAPIDGVRPVVRTGRTSPIRPVRTATRAQPSGPAPQAPALEFSPSSP